MWLNFSYRPFHFRIHLLYIYDFHKSVKEQIQAGKSIKTNVDIQRVRVNLWSNTLVLNVNIAKM